MDAMNIDGVLLTPLKIIDHPKGVVLHALKKGDVGFAGFGEAYFSTVEMGEIKGWKKHTLMTLNLVVPVGVVRFVVYDDRENSRTKGKYFETTLSLDHYQRLTVPPGLWMAFQGVGRDINLLMNLASVPHDPHEAINCDLQQIFFRWEE